MSRAVDSHTNRGAVGSTITVAPVLTFDDALFRRKVVARDRRCRLAYATLPIAIPAAFRALVVAADEWPALSGPILITATDAAFAILAVLEAVRGAWLDRTTRLFAGPEPHRRPSDSKSLPRSTSLSLLESSASGACESDRPR